MLKVVKFGGSSLSSEVQFAKVREIVDKDVTRKVVVVSAIGKRNKEDHKITDLLYLSYAHLEYGVDAHPIFQEIKDRYLEVEEKLGLKGTIDEDLIELESNLKKGIDQDYLVSRGEYLCAKLMAKYLGYAFIDAQAYLIFNYDGTLNEEITSKRIKEAYQTYGKIVCPGFYGAYPDGAIHLLSRGGSDVTGSILAKSLDATIYENWTDVSGFAICDPRIVANPLSIKEISYDELRELSYMGASVLHEDTIFPVQDLNIPINVRNTFRPNDAGTIITSKCKDTSQIITGITGKKNYHSITILKKPKTDKLSCMRKVLDVFYKFKVNVEHMPSSIDTFSCIVEEKNISKKLYEVIANLKQIEEIEDILVDSNIALIAIVGRNMALKPGISAKVFKTIGEKQINIKVIAQGSQELSIIVGVDNQDFEKAIRALYSGLVITEE